jgi:ribosome modulation factor
MSAYDRGVAAGRMGMEKDDNPYLRGTRARSGWNDGYEASVELNEAMELDFDWAR